ncbi:hypothetical protein V8C43DRAFT_268813 [Trichoderma afarasin]
MKERRRGIEIAMALTLTPSKGSRSTRNNYCIPGGRASNSSLEGGTDFIDDATGIVHISVLGKHRSRYHHTVREAGRNTRATRGRRSERGRGETRTCQRRIMPESGPGSARFRAQRADPIHGGHGGMLVCMA